MTDKPRLTIKQENFARAYVETGNASEAYRRSYDCEGSNEETIQRNAHTLIQDTKIATMVDSLKAEISAEFQVNVGSITSELVEAFEMAQENSQAGHMVSATMGKAKLHGLILDKQQITANNADLQTMTDAELADIEAKDLASRGLKLVRIDGKPT